MSCKYGKKIKGLKHLKYSFMWNRKFQISKMNLRTSLIQVEGSDVQHNLLFNYCNLLFLVFLCKKRYLDLGDLFPCFQVHLMLFRSNLIPDMVRCQLGLILEYILLYVKFYGALKQAPKSVNVFKKSLNKKSKNVSLCSSFGSS